MSNGSEESRARARAAREFVSEAEEILERMRSDLADLADALAASQDADPELINGLFRSAHSLKGAAGMFNLEEMGSLAHHLEEILDALRLGRMPLQPSALQLLDEAVATAGLLLERLQQGELSGDALSRVADLVQRIRAAVEQPSTSPALASASVALDPSLLRALTEYEEHRLRENLRRGKQIHLVEATFEILSFERSLSELTRAVRAVGELISTLPAPGEAPEAQIRFSLLVASDLSGDALEARLGQPNLHISAVHEPSAAVSEPRPGPTTAAPTARREPNVSPPAGDLGAPADSLRSISDTVRVDIHKLDDLMNLLGELMIQRGAVAAIAQRLAAERETARIGRELGKVHQALDRRLRDLQAGILEVRMVPLRQVFERLARVVRRLRRDTAKPVRLEIRGADTELDKLLVEELIDPLMHVVRNAFDHAIETPEQRVAAGKSPEGCIRLDAFQKGNHVVIEVADDGRGIDLQAVRGRALAMGLIAPDQTLGSKEIVELVFAAGLSTRTQVSDTSGRGVGMDVVRTNLAALGGVVDVRSEPGRGTTISFTLPITLAIIQALLVRVAQQRFALPLTAVRETLPLEAGSLQRSHHHEILNLRGEPLRLLRLNRVFGSVRSAPGGKPYVVVVGVGDARLGLIVDHLDGQQDVVIKPIHGPVASMRGIAGATDLGDQEAVLVLDVAALIDDAARSGETS